MLITQIIAQIRRSTSTISHLGPEHQAVAVNAYDRALHTVFLCNLGVAVVGFLGFLLVENVALPQAGEAKVKIGEEEGDP